MSEYVSEPDNMVTVPAPMPMEQRRGVRNLHSHGAPLAVRIHVDDIELLDAEAAILGVTRAAFIRWFAVLGAQALHQKRTGMRRDITP
jgi:hypothetical protein